ncbi:hypothetical protein D3C76_544960 [compost metagenome]|uniref:Uncharacterized membrane protein SirB2 n=1 Tax=Pseudomonas jinjuensis TaxID=198616 RepID=A0A1H0N7P2_9PSED|nr:SirB2 family protein [Pseudomonas jinjuensis]SDO88697.1 Uncharacterized membrane protein SirB2 [Pseudomonas jinjuensis]
MFKENSVYIWLKHLHISLAVASSLLFILRLALSWGGRRMQGWQRWAPHLVDTFLLLSALGLVHLAMPWPLPVWLQAKIGLLLLYIGFAAVAIRADQHGRKVAFSALSLGALGGIFFLALQKPWW